MTTAMRAVAFGVGALLVVAAFAGAGTPQAGFHFVRQAGQRAASTAGVQQGAAAAQGGIDPSIPNFCPGETIPYEVNLVGLDSIIAGEDVEGTIAFTTLLFQTCQVNAPTFGTCTVSPDGSTISFDLGNVQSPAGGDLSGNLLLPEDAPNCGTVTDTIDLTEPDTFHESDTTPYACDGVTCAIPATGRLGLLVLALLLAAIGVATLYRRVTG